LELQQLSGASAQAMIGLEGPTLIGTMLKHGVVAWADETVEAILAALNTEQMSEIQDAIIDLGGVPKSEPTSSEGGTSE
jgi:hypothetical protein